MSKIRNDDGNGGCKIRHGYRIFGETSTGGVHLWYCETLERAKELATAWVERHGGEYEIMKYLGSVEAVRPVFQAKWIGADDGPQPATPAAAKEGT